MAKRRDKKAERVQRIFELANGESRTQWEYVNQKGFDGLTATSIFNETGAFSSITEQMFSLIHSMNEVFARHKSDFTTLKKMYETHLYRKNVRAKFEDVHGKFTGVIQGTTDQGELIVLRDNQQEQTYSLKEISFIF